MRTLPGGCTEGGEDIRHLSRLMDASRPRAASPHRPPPRASRARCSGGALHSRARPAKCSHCRLRIVKNGNTSGGGSEPSPQPRPELTATRRPGSSGFASRQASANSAACGSGSGARGCRSARRHVPRSAIRHPRTRHQPRLGPVDGLHTCLRPDMRTSSNPVPSPTKIPASPTRSRSSTSCWQSPQRPSGSSRCRPPVTSPPRTVPARRSFSSTTRSPVAHSQTRTRPARHPDGREPRPAFPRARRRATSSPRKRSSAGDPGSWLQAVAGLDDGCAESHNRVRPRPAGRSSWPNGTAGHTCGGVGPGRR